MSTSITPATPVKLPARYFVAGCAALVVSTAGSVWGTAAWLNSRQLAQAERDRAQDERIAAVESWRATAQTTLEKIDGRLDRLADTMGKVAESLARIDERTKRP